VLLIPIHRMQYVTTCHSWARTRGAQLSAGYTVNTPRTKWWRAMRRIFWYHRRPIPLLSVDVFIARTLKTRDRQTDMKPKWQYPAERWELSSGLAGQIPVTLRHWQLEKRTDRQTDRQTDASASLTVYNWDTSPPVFWFLYDQWSLWRASRRASQPTQSPVSHTRTRTVQPTGQAAGWHVPTLPRWGWGVGTINL